MASHGELGRALPAAQARRHPLKVQRGPRGNGPAAEKVKVELDRIVDDAAQVADHEVDLRDAGGLGLLGVFCGNPEDVFGDR